MTTATKLRPLSKISSKGQQGLVATSLISKYERRTSNMDILFQAQTYWSHMARFRRERERNKKYNYGDQWGDEITVDGKRMKEEDYILSQGNIPLKNNLIRRLVKNVLGVYRAQSKEPTCVARDRQEQQLGETMSMMLQCNWQMNRMNELNARSFEEFLISGLVVHRKSFGWRHNKYDCWTDYVHPNNFFIDNLMRDFRGWDVSFIGEFHDMTFGELCNEFAKSPKDCEVLRNIYATASQKDALIDSSKDFGYALSSVDFFTPNGSGLCRVFEIWNKESKPRYRCHDYLNGSYYKIEEGEYYSHVEAENQRRLTEGLAQGMDKSDIPLIEAEWFMDHLWYFRFLSPLGHVLMEGETPYDHKSHPYAFKMYPFIDGEIHSFAGDVLDQQRYVNRLISMQDWIMRASAKGVLLFPEEALPEGVDLDDVSDQWSRYNGVIAIKTKGLDKMPTQISNNSTNIGINELLSLQLKLFEDISGVNGALQGKPGYSGTSGSLYAQQTQNATTSLLDLLESFSSFIIDGAYKDVKNMQQFYDAPKIFNISGNTKEVMYDPSKSQDVEFDLSIVESTSSPAYRQIANEFLMQIWGAGQISLEQLLQHGDFPFADKLLESVKLQKEQLENGQPVQGLPEDLASQAQGGADPKALQLLSQYLGTPQRQVA